MLGSRVNLKHIKPNRLFNKNILNNASITTSKLTIPISSSIKAKSNNVNSNLYSKSIFNQILNNNNSYKRFYSTNEQKQQEQQEQKSQQQQQQKEEKVNEDEEIEQSEPNKKVGRWLLFSCGLVGAMIVIGGITRLTESGLSMVEWKPVVGTIPPLTQEEWEAEFEKYKQFPEYKKLNMGMTLDEFKQIFFWEYSHRLLGRVIGVAFFFPFVYYLKKGYIDRSLAKKLSVVFLMGGAQGALGWYMVKSGLDEKLIQGEVPRVSQYRLAAHLGSAFVIYTALFWFGLGLVRPAAIASNPNLQNFAPKMKKYSHAVAGLIGVTAMSGAFVAGLDAGLVYNTFPKMGDDWIPDDIINPKIKPAYKNCFEHDVTVQFQHRVLACITYGSILALTAFAYRGRKALSPKARLAVNSLAVMGTAQVILGISTLLTFVPVSLAASHQAGSLTLLTIATWLLRELKKLPK
ncbi:hypothetical protein DICPUDRAFT_54540 [Dictyostelium purpureum]|uniref:Cytochrome c oxidase assembly protein n=1 Tax=Dictyostelium purpureum TaxID=5786 RepID=F0ZHG6_DICPU|nr:uncharacterized protein DICPUDRAFT_54540 [Dictyostelium purpureum]EGC36625.1 hypothetical protein DICPUDRAFT_54540 [Dictyostelium purpureum]|eukprot:XP_003286863.1 hypothetical protein DICPUDRAFT_54540 [Dictyostelium purpureum]